MTKFTTLILLMAFVQPANCQQVTPLNAHYFAITDTIKYKPVFYSHTIEDSDSLYIYKTYDTLGKLSGISRTWFTKEKKRKVPVKMQSITFSPTGDTLQMRVSDLLEKNERIYHYDEGIQFSEVYRENSYFISGCGYNGLICATLFGLIAPPVSVQTVPV